MSGADAPAAHFVEKWYLQEPEMRFAAVFCARADAAADAQAQPRFECWGALLRELREALFELADPGVGAAKRGWWAEELQAIAKGSARHPLGESLAALPEAKAAPWTGLSLALVGAGGDAHAADTPAAIAALLPLAQATVAVENALFRARNDAREGAEALAVHWLLHRLPRGLGQEDGARIPMHLLARHGLTLAQLPEAPETLLRDWARELGEVLPPNPEGAFIRRARRSFDEVRLRKLAGNAGGKGGYWSWAPSPIPTLWRAWRAARAG
jgi:hypothetical protein